MKKSFKLKVEQGQECWDNLDFPSRKKILDDIFGDNGYPFQTLHENWKKLTEGYDESGEWFRNFVENINSYV